MVGSRGFLAGRPTPDIFSLLILSLPELVILIIAKAIGTPASCQIRETSLATCPGETLNAIAIGVLYEMQLVIDEVVMFQGYGTLLVQYQRNRLVYPANPVGEFLRITDRSREANQLNMWR